MTGTAAHVVALLRDAGSTLATAESLTGGLVGAAITGVPGASVVYRGGVVAYATDLKGVLLGVDADLLARHGAVHEEVAAAMARGAGTRLGATYGIATTGVAGPEPQDGQAVGTVFVALALPDRIAVRRLALAGDRAAVRAATVEAVLQLVLDEVGPAPADSAAGTP